MTNTEAAGIELARLKEIEADIAAGRLAEAEAAFATLAPLVSTDVRVHLAGAMLGQASRDPQREIASLRRAAQLAPNSPHVQRALAKALSRHGLHDDAVRTANAAAQLAPGDIATLEVAVAIADAAGDLETTRRHLQAALTLRPGDVSIRRALGRCLAKQGRHGNADNHWRVILAENPDDLFALRWRGAGLIALERKDEARAVLEHALSVAPGDPGLQFHLAIARGETPRSAPPAMIENLFDGYATRFDRQIVERLHYHVPERVAEIILARPAGRDVSVLDLGCGTGLLALHLGRVSGPFVGVDVSARMIEQAARREVYTALRRGDLLEELRNSAAGAYDCVTALDVFIYVGELGTVIPAACEAVRNGGALIFSCETAEPAEGDLVLRRSQRYAHSRESIRKLCRDAGFASCAIEPIDVRLEGDKPIPGFIAVAQKS